MRNEARRKILGRDESRKKEKEESKKKSDVNKLQRRKTQTWKNKD